MSFKQLIFTVLTLAGVSLAQIINPPFPAAPLAPSYLRSFGAAGDGVTDDTVAVQAWVNSCSSIASLFGCDLAMNPGHYKVTSTITGTGTLQFHMYCLGGTSHPSAGDVAPCTFEGNIPGGNIMTLGTFGNGSLGRGMVIENIEFRNAGSTTAGTVTGLEIDDLSDGEYRNLSFSRFQSPVNGAPANCGTLAVNNSGGTLGNVTVFVKCAWYNGGWSLASSEQSIVTGAGCSGACWVSVPGPGAPGTGQASQYVVYASTTTGTEKLQNNCCVSTPLASTFAIGLSGCVAPTNNCSASVVSNTRGTPSIDHSGGDGIRLAGSQKWGTATGFVNQPKVIHPRCNVDVTCVDSGPAVAIPWIENMDCIENLTRSCVIAEGGGVHLYMNHYETTGTGTGDYVVFGNTSETTGSFSNWILGDTFELSGSGATPNAVRCIRCRNSQFAMTVVNASAGTGTGVNLDATSTGNKVYVQTNGSLLNPWINSGTANSFEDPAGDAGFPFTFGTPVAIANLWQSPTVPTIAGAGCGGSAAAMSGTPNGTASFNINVGTAPTAPGCTVTMPAAATGWNCTCSDLTTTSTSVFYCKQTGAVSTTAVTFQLFSDVAVATAPVASDILRVQCDAN